MKTQINISLPGELKAECKARKLNISKIVTEYLLDYLNLETQELKEKREINNLIEKDQKLLTEIQLRLTKNRKQLILLDKLEEENKKAAEEERKKLEEEKNKCAACSQELTHAKMCWEDDIYIHRRCMEKMVDMQRANKIMEANKDD